MTRSKQNRFHCVSVACLKFRGILIPKNKWCELEFRCIPINRAAVAAVINIFFANFYFFISLYLMLVSILCIPTAFAINTPESITKKWAGDSRGCLVTFHKRFRSTA